MRPPLGGHPPSSGGRQCKSEGAERRQEASGKTKPRKRTKTRANRHVLTKFQRYRRGQLNKGMKLLRVAYTLN